MCVCVCVCVCPRDERRLAAGRAAVDQLHLQNDFFLSGVQKRVHPVDLRSPGELRASPIVPECLWKTW